MKNRKEGYIKFCCDWHKAKPWPATKLRNLIAWRNKLKRLGLIGVYPDGIGFGNISIRAGRTLQFFITGSQTGQLRKFAVRHCTKVISGSLAKNEIVCEGPVKASSESLTHLAVYKASPSIKAVIHVHWPEFWHKMAGKLPTTKRSVRFGTPAMGREVLRLTRRRSVLGGGIVLMGGHKDGVLVFGRDLEAAGYVIMGRKLHSTGKCTTKRLKDLLWGPVL